MRFRFYGLVLMAALILVASSFCCSKGEKGKGFSLDAGPPPRPLFYDFEGLRWGMTPGEIIGVWGPPKEDPQFEKGFHDMRYSNRAGFKYVTLYFITVPPFRNVHLDVLPKEGSTNPLPFLFAISLDPGTDDIKPKEAVRADLVLKFKEPVADPKIYESQDRSREHAEIFRAAECTLVIAQWAKAEPSVNWPERLDSLQYTLVPYCLVTEIPRTKWKDLRGAIPLSPTSDIKARYQSFTEGASPKEVKDLVEIFGPPNLYQEEAPGIGTLHYFWLTGSRFKFTIGEGKIRGYERTYVHEPQ